MSLDSLEYTVKIRFPCLFSTDDFINITKTHIGTSKYSFRTMLSVSQWNEHLWNLLQLNVQFKGILLKLKRKLVVWKEIDIFGEKKTWVLKLMWKILILGSEGICMLRVLTFMIYLVKGRCKQFIQSKQNVSSSYTSSEKIVYSSCVLFAYLYLSRDVKFSWGIAEIKIVSKKIFDSTFLVWGYHCHGKFLLETFGALGRGPGKIGGLVTCTQ